MSNDVVTEPKQAVEEDTAVAASAARNPRTVSIRLSTVALAVALVALAVTTAVFASLWVSERGKVSDRDAAAAADKHAEQVATDYAVGASNINFQDVNAWVAKLKANTTPQLANKFDATAPKLQDILVPLKWTSTATPITAKVMSSDNGIYKVNVFLNVTSTSAQTPEGAQTTVTYTVNVDPNNGWKVADVGGMAGALPKQ
ncbi:hypothetical protein NDR87_32105 [Nocardia sp. CDC159]|uniref:Mce-associated membrane protein n=1 Tax=Nocardia pulmonis TaxID=2951408 RepID=A0A9X2J2K7_9NOCA|nr:MULTISPECIES: hypothetical protein [Nocardia]MCM6778136.1 hypothetical protein [Nocardia pulmonis]MCM6791025.1 hypothetical protein [Nocardia sp. CDC159]